MRHGTMTTRKRALPRIIRSLASLAFSSGWVSIVQRTPVSALKRNVSSESADVPDGLGTYHCRFAPPSEASSSLRSGLAVDIAMGAEFDRKLFLLLASSNRQCTARVRRPRFGWLAFSQKYARWRYR